MLILRGGTIEKAAELRIPAKFPERQFRKRTFVSIKLNLHRPTPIIMKISHSRPLGLLKAMVLFLAVGFIIPIQALYFYIEGTTPKCFYEELPKDTLVVGEQNPPIFSPIILGSPHMDCSIQNPTEH